MGLNYKLQNHVADWLKVVPRKRNVGLNELREMDSAKLKSRFSQEERGFEFFHH